MFFFVYKTQENSQSRFMDIMMTTRETRAVAVYVAYTLHVSRRRAEGKQPK